MATVAAAVMAKTRRDILSHFMSANAVTPETAVGFEPVRRIQRRMFERLRGSDVLIQARPGPWYLDVARYDEQLRKRRRRAGIAVATIAGVAAIVAALA